MGFDMSNLSQFSNTPAVGEFTVADPVSWALNPTVNGKEYLSASFKPYSATYANLITAYKYYGYVNQTSTVNSTWNQTNGTSATVDSKITCTTDGNFNLWSGTKVYSGTSLTTTRTGGGGFINNAGGTLANTTDAIAFGNVLVCVWYDSGAVLSGLWIATSTNYGSTWSSTTYNFTGGDQFGGIAQNGSTSAVAYNQLASTSAGNVFTTTNGTTWTSRAFSADMTVGATVRIVRCVYAPSISAYVYVNANGSIWTSTDGYTLTARTSPSGMPSGITPFYYMQSNFSASSATSTLILVSSTAGTKILKVTSGPTFSIIDLTALNSYLPVQYPLNSIAYDGTRFVASNQYGQIFYSADEGVTWTRDFTLWNSTTGTSFGPYAGNATVSSLAYVNSQLLCNSVPYGLNTNNPLILTGRLLQSTPDYIGNGGGYYLRIA